MEERKNVHLDVEKKEHIIEDLILILFNYNFT